MLRFVEGEPRLRQLRFRVGDGSFVASVGAVEPDLRQGQAIVILHVFQRFGGGGIGRPIFGDGIVEQIVVGVLGVAQGLLRIRQGGAVEDGLVVAQVVLRLGLGQGGLRAAAGGIPCPAQKLCQRRASASVRCQVSVKA